MRQIGENLPRLRFGHWLRLLTGPLKSNSGFSNRRIDQLQSWAGCKALENELRGKPQFIRITFEKIRAVRTMRFLQKKTCHNLCTASQFVPKPGVSKPAADWSLSTPRILKKLTKGRLASERRERCSNLEGCFQNFFHFYVDSDYDILGSVACGGAPKELYLEPPAAPGSQHASAPRASNPFGP